MKRRLLSRLWNDFVRSLRVLIPHISRNDHLSFEWIHHDWRLLIYFSKELSKSGWSFVERSHERDGYGYLMPPIREWMERRLAAPAVEEKLLQRDVRTLKGG